MTNEVVGKINTLICSIAREETVCLRIKAGILPKQSRIRKIILIDEEASVAEKRVATVNCLKADCPHHPTQSRDDVPLSQFLLDVSFIPCESHVVLLGIPRIEGICSEEITSKGHTLLLRITHVA